MAKHMIIQMTDDIDGGAIANGSGESIDFSVDGIDYRIDLNNGHAEEFHRTLDYYIEHAERVGGRKRRLHGTGAVGKSSTSAKQNREQSRAIREWANTHGYQLSSRGRIPDHVIEAFDNAQ